MPSLLESTHTGVRDKKSELALSRFESIFMFLCYCLYLVFQLKTHRWGRACAVALFTSRQITVMYHSIGMSMPHRV